MLRFGIDELLSNSPNWKKKRLALLTNQAATTNTLAPSRKALLDNGFGLVRLFSPEHGLQTDAADGHKVTDGVDHLTGLPVVSLYSEKLRPAAEDLADIDIVLFDVPDIGARFYTYLWTLTHLIEACAAHGKKCIVLDRPNPVSGMMERAEGPMLSGERSSFIGRWPMPVRHSCTLGELARYFNVTRQIGCELEVIRCEGWERTMLQPDWDIPFVPTSPAIQNFDAMLLYPGICLLEATNICEGRGTDHSFTSATAPWIDANILAGIVAPMLEEWDVHQVDVIPAHSKYAGQTCYGISIKAREPRYYQSVMPGMLLIKLIKDLYPQHFQWHPYPTLVNPDGNDHLDKLLGIPNATSLYERNFRQFITETQKLTRTREWEEMVKAYLMY